MPPTLLSGPEVAPKSGHVRKLVILLHGVGSNGDDLIGLASQMMDLPDTQLCSPHAPFAYDMAPFGYQWFSPRDRNFGPMLAGVQTAAPVLNHYIDQQIARFGLTDADVALVGFSQGSMMSFYTAPRRPRPLAGVVAVCGAMLGAETLAAEITAKPPFCIIHGEQDPVVPFIAMGHAAAALTSNGVVVETHARPGLGHGMDERGIEIAEAFLRKVLGLE